MRLLRPARENCACFIVIFVIVVIVTIIATANTTTVAVVENTAKDGFTCAHGAVARIGGDGVHAAVKKCGSRERGASKGAV